ncbi:fimbrial protein [Escherichia coli]|nr:fimbrial protein [Escherichia coli]QAU57218.1 fimbrial protein [Escherichia coli]QAU76624.1 fimbrial protein [Escherichia coli]
MVTFWGNYEGISQSKALMSGNVKNAQIASVKVQYLDKQKKLAVMNIEYN